MSNKPGYAGGVKMILSLPVAGAAPNGGAVGAVRRWNPGFSGRPLRASAASCRAAGAASTPKTPPLFGQSAQIGWAAWTPGFPQNPRKQKNTLKHKKTPTKRTNRILENAPVSQKRDLLRRTAFQTLLTTHSNSTSCQESHAPAAPRPVSEKRDFQGKYFFRDFSPLASPP